MDAKNTYKYQIKQGRKILVRDVTSLDLVFVEKEYQVVNPNVKLVQIGRKTTFKDALKWKRAGGRRPYSKLAIMAVIDKG